MPDRSDSATSHTFHKDQGMERPAPDESDVGPEIVAYRLNRSPLALVCAPGARDWMDATDERFA